MLSTAHLEQLERLTSSELVELVELHNVIQTKLDDDLLAGQRAILEQRVAEADTNPDDFITLDEWKARRSARRSA